MNKTYSILVADGTRARFFTLEAGAQLTGETVPALTEHADRVNPEHELAGRDKYSTTRTGVNLNPAKGPTHGYDDHRDKEEREHERRFAQDIARHALQFARQKQAACLVVVAEKRMLGLLRDELVLPPHSGIEVRELAKDLTRLTTDDLHSHLAEAGLIPVHHARINA
jgi:protein required for attachment to host cells